MFGAHPVTVYSLGWACVWAKGGTESGIVHFEECAVTLALRSLVTGTFPAGWSERLIQMAKCEVFIWSDQILIIKIFFLTSQQIINDQT